MYVHEEKGLCFIAHPRTASTATGQVLLSLGFNQVINHHGFKPGLIPKHWDVFSTVRDPFDVLVSWYWKSRREQDFKDWLPVFIRDSNEYLDRGLFFGAPYCQYRMHYETLQEDFNWVLVTHGFPPTEIPRRNVSERRDGRSLADYYDSKLTNLIQDHFGKEIRQNGYGVPCQDS